MAGTARAGSASRAPGPSSNLLVCAGRRLFMQYFRRCFPDRLTWKVGQGPFVPARHITPLWAAVAPAVVGRPTRYAPRALWRELPAIRAPRADGSLHGDTHLAGHTLWTRMVTFPPRSAGATAPLTVRVRPSCITSACVIGPTSNPRDHEAEIGVGDSVGLVRHEEARPATAEGVNGHGLGRWTGRSRRAALRPP